MEDQVNTPVPPPNPYNIVRMAAANETPAYPVTKIVKASKWVQYGAKNLFPQEVLQMSGKSPVNDALIKSTVTYVCGKGVSDSSPDSKKYIGAPNNLYGWDALIGPTATDFKTFNGLYFQVVVNKGSDTVSVFHQDFSTVRVGEVDEFGNPVNFRISWDWSKTTGKNKPITLEVWPGSIKKAKKGVNYLYYYWAYTPGLRFYCAPDWWAAEDFVRADGKLGPFYNNSIDNNFTPSVVFTFPSNPDKSVRDEVQTELEDSYAGVPGACSVITLWGEGANGSAPTATAFNAAKNADIYINVETQIFQKIISAHRLSSPTLAGVSGAGSLSGNAAEIIDSFILYNYTVIEQIRRQILDCVNIFTKINGTAAVVIEDLDVIKKINESKSPNSILTITDGSKGSAAAIESLASKLGVGGTQALTDVMAGPLPDDQKRGLLAVLFGLGEADINKLFNPTKLSAVQRFVNAFMIWK